MIEIKTCILKGLQMPENCQNQWELPEDVSLRVQLRIQSLDIYIYISNKRIKDSIQVGFVVVVVLSCISCLLFMQSSIILTIRSTKKPPCMWQPSGNTEFHLQSSSYLELQLRFQSPNVPSILRLSDSEDCTNHVRKPTSHHYNCPCPTKFSCIFPYLPCP